MPKISKHILSKSTFVRGVQCEKSLYFNKYQKELREEVSENLKALYSRGSNVGLLAQQLFPGGIDCTPDHFYNWVPSIEKTQDLIERGQKVIYEASFQFEGVLAAIDILINHKGKWYAYEVKSSTSVKGVYELDAALQYYVITNSGLKLADIKIVHLNNKYIRKGELELKKLFVAKSVLEKSRQKQTYIKQEIQKSKEILAIRRVPSKAISPHCFYPYKCDFMKHCWENIPNYSVFNLTKGGEKSWELYNSGVLELKDIPSDFSLTEGQKIQVNAEKTGEEFVNLKELKRFLSELNYPLYHFDFETFTSAAPIFEDTKPYQQIPFQYSLHIETTTKIKHKEYLANPKNGDPREDLIRQMIIDLDKKGDVLVYNIAFESARINELIHDFPMYKKSLLAIKNRLKDLATPFQYKYYYTKEMKGKYSIKNVLPAIVSELSYEEMIISNGADASRIFGDMIDGIYEGDEEEARENLLKYCKMDTFAMVKILEKLKEVTS